MLQQLSEAGVDPVVEVLGRVVEVEVLGRVVEVEVLGMAVEVEVALEVELAVEAAQELMMGFAAPIVQVMEVVALEELVALQLITQIEASGDYLQLPKMRRDESAARHAAGVNPVVDKTEETKRQTDRDRVEGRACSSGQGLVL